MIGINLKDFLILLMGGFAGYLFACVQQGFNKPEKSVKELEEKINRYAQK